MKENTTCSVIEDLLPLYMEQLTKEETNEFIEEHLKECSSCSSLYHSMKEEDINGEEQVSENTEAVKELDYLKKIRSRSRKKIWFAIGGVMFAILIGALVKLFVYGSSSQINVSDLSVKDGKVKIQGAIVEDDLVYSHYKIVEKNGQKKLVVYAARASFWNTKNNFEIECSMEKIKDEGLIVDDQKITASGNVVSRRAANVYEYKHPYIGDMFKNQVLADVLGVGEELGSYTNELQTETMPYGWTLYFQTILEESNETIFNEKMRAYAYVLLAAIDNLDEITWSYMVEAADGMKQQAVTLTVLEAEAMLGTDLKAFTGSEEGIEDLLVKVGLSQNGSGKIEEKDYKYRLTLTGRMHNAECDSTFVVLTNNPDLTFEEVAKSLYSSDSNDSLKDAVIISMR